MTETVDNGGHHNPWWKAHLRLNQNNDAGGRTSGKFGVSHSELVELNHDWFRVIGRNKDDGGRDDPICTLLVVDREGEHTVCERSIDIFDDCVSSVCSCTYLIGGVQAQLKPCRVFVECYCRGATDPDWGYILRGEKNYSSITKGDVGVVMSGRLQVEINVELLTIVDKQCLCTHALGVVPKGEDDVRAIVDCSSPDGNCVNDHTRGCRVNFCYNSVESVTELLIEGDYCATVDISNTYRAINIHPVCRERQGLSWDFSEGVVYLRDNRLCMGLSSSPFVFSKVSDFVVRCMVRKGHAECINYLDDFCLIARTLGECRAGQLKLVAILRRLGFYISFKKLTHPSQIVRFLGIDIDSVRMEFR